GSSDLVRKSNVHTLKNLRSASLRKGRGHRPGHRPRNLTEKPAKPNRRNPCYRRDTSRHTNPNQQEVTEGTEDSVGLRSLRCLLFKSPSAARSCRTPRLCDPATMTPAMQSRRDRGVRCSRL